MLTIDCKNYMKVFDEKSFHPEDPSFQIYFLTMELIFKEFLFPWLKHLLALWRDAYGVKRVKRFQIGRYFDNHGHTNLSH